MSKDKIDITKVLQDRCYDMLVEAGLTIDVNAEEWAAIEELYASRGDDKPNKPVFQGIPIIKKTEADNG